jgi:hypothetical protein
MRQTIAIINELNDSEYERIINRLSKRSNSQWEKVPSSERKIL